MLAFKTFAVEDLMPSRQFEAAAASSSSKQEHEAYDAIDTRQLWLRQLQ
jgi:hypothetical protein